MQPSTNQNSSNDNDNNNRMIPIVRIVGNQMQIIFFGNDPPPNRVSEYTTTFTFNAFDLIIDYSFQAIRCQHTLFRNVLRPISGTFGIIGSLIGAFEVITGRDKLREFLRFSIPSIISICVFAAVGGPIGFIMAGILAVYYSKMVSAAYDGRLTDDSDISMIEMIAALLALILLPTPPDEGGGGGDGSYETNDDDDDGGGGGNGSTGRSSAKNPGGVEFKNIQPIIGIKSPELFLSKTNNIFLKLDSEKDILDTFNMLVLPGFKNKSIREYFDTIMKEASDSIYAQIELPFVSLHFNKEGFLYSVMPNYYKNTLTGNILAFIDYFMKGFVNGGFFNIEFVRNWANSPPNNRITNTDILNANLINVKQELLKAGVKSLYYPLNEIIDQDRTANEFYSAFRIIGEMKGIGKADDVLFPIELFSVEYDLDTKPEMQKLLDSDDLETKEYYNNIQSMFILMKKIIKTTMPQVPQFRGLFPILDMITFAFHYAISLRSIGRAVNTEFAFQNQGENYIHPIPDVFPPLPVAEKQDVKIKIEMTSIIECIQKTSFDTEITNILNSEQEEFSQKCLSQIMAEIDAFYRRKIAEVIGNDIKYDDQTIRISSFKEATIDFIKNIPNLIKNELFKLLSNIEEIIKARDPSIEETSSALTFFELVMKAQERLEMLTRLVNENDEQNQNEIQQDQVLLNQLREYERNLMTMNQVPQIVNLLQQVRNNIHRIENDINNEETRNVIKNQMLESLKNQVMNLSRTAESFMSTYNETLKFYSYNSHFYLVTPKIKDINQCNKIVGGCKVKFAKNTFIQVIPKSEKELLELNKIVRDKGRKECFVHSSNGISGLVMKLEIIPLPVDGINLKNLSFNKELVKTQKIDPKKVKKIDLKFLISNLIKKQHDTEGTKNITPAYRACCSGDVYTISLLIENGADFGKTYENGVYPFLATIMGGYHDAAIMLLTHPNAKIGNINRSTESGITPLYYAIYYNFPDIVDLLLKKGASPTLPIRSNGMSSAHIACYLDRFECLKIIAQSTHENIYVESLGGLTPLQVALAHSPRCAMFLISQKKDANFFAIDPRNYTTHDIAIMNGFYELCKMLPNEGKMKDLLNINNVIQKENEFDKLCNAFSSGNLEKTEKLVKQWLSQTSPSTLDKKSKEKLVECACAGGCVGYIEILSKILNIQYYPIALSAAHFGLIDWIPEIEKYGGKLMDNVDKWCILDEAVNCSDYEFLKKAFETVGHISSKIIKRVIKAAINIGHVNTMIVISEALSQEKEMQYLNPANIISPNLSVTAFNIFKNNFDPQKKVNLLDFVEIVSSQLISFLISKYHFTNDELKNACKSAIINERFDNAFVICEKSTNVTRQLRRKQRYNIVEQLTEESKKVVFEITNNLIDDEMIPEKEKIKQLKDALTNIFNVGDIHDEDGFSLIDYAGLNMKNFWILKVIHPRYINRFRLSKLAFTEKMINLLFQKLIQTFESIFGRKKSGKYFLNSLKELDFLFIEKSGKGNEFISSLLSTMSGSYLVSKDDDDQTVFHYISKIGSISVENMDLLVSSINKYHSMTKRNIMNERSRKGETILMNIAKSGNLKSIEFIIEKVVKNIEVPLFIRDNHGDNIIHKILNGKDASNDKVIYYVSLLIKKCPELLLQRNRSGKNPFMVAAENGFNGILGLMSTVYPIKLLDSSPECSVIHLAAKNNHRETIRYIVQYLHIDANALSKDGLTPLHFAALKSSLLAYQELLSLGANPLIVCNKFDKMNAIDFAMRFGAEKMIKTVMETPSFNVSLSKTDILFHLAMNKEGYKGFNAAMKFYQDSVINSCNSFGRNIISLACMPNNRQIVADALMIGGDPEIIDADGKNSIHICAEYNSIGCSDLILNHINALKGSISIKSILNVKDSNGNLPIHIACHNGFSGFVAHLLCICNEQNYNDENNSGFTPFAESIKNGHKKVAGIFVYWMESLNKSPGILVDKLSPELKKKWESDFLISEDYQYAKEIVKKMKENIWKPMPPPEFTNRQNNKIITNADILDEIFKKVQINLSHKIIKNYAPILMNSTFQSIITYLLTDKENLEIVKKIIKSVTIIRSKKIRKISFLILFPIIYKDDIDQFISKITKIDQMQIDESNPLFSWIENGLITIAETNKDPKVIIQQIQVIIDLALYVLNDEELKNTIPYPILPVPVHEAASFIMSIKADKYRRIQILFANLIKVSSIWKYEPLLSIDFGNKIDEGQNSLFNYVLEHKALGGAAIVRAIQVTKDLYEDHTLNNNEKEMIMIQCISLISKNDNPKSIKNEFTAWITNSERIINEFGIDYYNQIIPIIPQDSLSIANKAISYILSIGSPKIADKKLIRKGIDNLKECALRIQNGKNVESRNLDESIAAFNEGTGQFIPYKFAFDGTPVVKLKQKELQSLEEFGHLLEKENKVNNILDASQEKGKAFRDHPTIENAAELVAIVRQAIYETYNINPFIVQCLTVCAMLLHRINKKNRSQLKGRIAQVATGEGKSIIIAMLAGCIGLTGSCVDIISSSMYLAKRDAEKYKLLYEKLGLRCGIVNENDFSTGFDYHILYSTNVGFEFAILHEGLSGKKIIETTPLYENAKKKRQKMTTIVDEADNLFIDTAMNPAQYSQGGSSKLSWIFKFIWNSVNKMILDKQAIRQILIENASNEEQVKDVNNISDDKLVSLIKNALHAIKLQRDVNYVVGKNKVNGEEEIQIIDADNTGRIRHGCRWSGGLHEFVELKEGIQLHEQTYTVASISHPSFFELYDEIYGLTGTLGEAPERKEIMQIYKVDTFDVPPNRKCLRKRDKTLIVETSERKEALIIDTIKNMKRYGRPILVLVYSIKDSQRLSNLLRNERIDHFLLNDQQKQDEDFIIDRAGLPGSVTIATNTAGRGTDIRIDKTSLRNGGLHTLITFWPANIRVECQALGRSARQGQPGSCQIIFESEEFGDDENEPTEETLKSVYEKRTNGIALRAEFREDLIKKEKLIYSILNQYFNYIFNLRKFLESSESVLNADFKGASSSIILEDLAICWSHFYTSFRNENEPSEGSFYEFLDQWSFDKKYPQLSERYKQFISNESNNKSSPIWTPTPSTDEYNPSYSYDNEELIDNLIAMGFESQLCKIALKRSKNNIERAIEILVNGQQMQKDQKKNESENETKTENDLLSQLMAMGFEKQACERALQLANNNIEIATTLLLNGSLNGNKKKTDTKIDSKLSDLMMMGFDEKKSRDALKKAKNDVNKAIDILSRQEILDPKIDRMVNDLTSMGFDRTSCINALKKCKNNFNDALEQLIADSEKKGNDDDDENVQAHEIDSKIFGDLKNLYENLTNAEKVAVFHLLDYGNPREVLQVYISCDKNEEAAIRCFS